MWCCSGFRSWQKARLSGIVLALCLVPGVVHAALAGDEQAVYTQAVEDFRFGDYKTALSKLEPLFKAHPDDVNIAEYIGRSYEESGNTEAAVSFYGQWLKASKQQGQKADRFAWLGLARALIRLKRHRSAAASLRQWRAYAPNDAEAAILQGSTLMRLKQYDEAAPIWDEVLAIPGVSLKDQAAVHYYKAFVAYTRGDLKAQKEQASLSLKKDPEGPYAPVARQFLEAAPARKPGLTASATLEVNYTSNVELLPDFSTPVAGGSRADVMTQPTLSLVYNLEKASLGYVFTRGFHGKRNDLDLGYHSAYGLWGYGNWFAMPRFEYMTLGGNFLTYSLGGDIGWRTGNYKLVYNLRYNQYSKNLNGTDLRRLGGWTNSLTGELNWNQGDVALSAKAGLSNLMAKGDAVSYAKSDSYWQSDLGGSLVWSKNKWMANATIAGYYRKYKQAAPILPTLVRRDSNISLSGRVAWLMLERKAWLARLTANTGWQKNNSNDSTKSYKEWHAGGGVQLDW